MHTFKVEMERTFKRDSEIISFRGGEKFSNETDKIVSFRRGGDRENIKYPYPNKKPNEILISKERMRWSSSIPIYRGSQNIIDIWSDKH